MCFSFRIFKKSAGRTKANPTVSELIKAKAECNAACMEVWKKLILKKFYSNWVNEIDKNSHLRPTPNVTVHGMNVPNEPVIGLNHYEFKYSLILAENKDFLLDCWSAALDIIQTEHPDLRIKADVTNDVLHVTANYENCLDDEIDIDRVREEDLVKTWRKMYV